MSRPFAVAGEKARRRAASSSQDAAMRSTSCSIDLIALDAMQRSRRTSGEATNRADSSGTGAGSRGPAPPGPLAFEHW